MDHRVISIPRVGAVTTSLVLFVALVTIRVGPAFSRHKPYRYSIKTREVNWTSASQSCLDWGEFASIHSEHENKDFFVLMDEVKPHKVWAAGFRGPDPEEKFQWLDGSPFNYTSWAIGQPRSHNGNEACLSLAVSQSAVVWNASPCNTALYHLCYTAVDDWCPEVPAPANGNVTVTSRSIGGTASFECDEGYALPHGAGVGYTKTCADFGGDTGNWTATSENDPVCEEISTTTGAVPTETTTSPITETATSATTETTTSPTTVTATSATVEPTPTTTPNEKEGDGASHRPIRVLVALLALVATVAAAAM